MTPPSVKQLLPENWKAFRDIRLEALKTNPEVYGGNYADARTIPEQEWRSTLSESDRAAFGAFSEDTIVGLGFARLMDESRQRAGFFMGYINPSFRKLGLFKSLYEARLDWVRRNGGKEIFVHNRASNQAAIRTNQAFGFQEKFRQETKWPDNSLEDEIIFELHL